MFTYVVLVNFEGFIVIIMLPFLVLPGPVRIPINPLLKYYIKENEFVKPLLEYRTFPSVSASSGAFACGPGIFHAVLGRFRGCLGNELGEGLKGAPLVKPPHFPSK